MPRWQPGQSGNPRGRPKRSSSQGSPKIYPSFTAYFPYMGISARNIPPRTPRRSALGDLLYIHESAWTAKPLSTRTGVLEPGSYPLLNQCPRKFRHRPDNLEHSKNKYVIHYDRIAGYFKHLPMKPHPLAQCEPKRPQPRSQGWNLTWLRRGDAGFEQLHDWADVPIKRRMVYELRKGSR